MAYSDGALPIRAARAGVRELKERRLFRSAFNGHSRDTTMLLTRGMMRRTLSVAAVFVFAALLVYITASHSIQELNEYGIKQQETIHLGEESPATEIDFSDQSEFATVAVERRPAPHVVPDGEKVGEVSGNVFTNIDENSCIVLAKYGEAIETLPMPEYVPPKSQLPLEESLIRAGYTLGSLV